MPVGYFPREKGTCVTGVKGLLRGLDVLAGGGEMGALMRAHDWSESPLGDPESWPQSLRSVVQIMLSNRQLMFVAWGPELAFLYNDGYAPTFGAKHPWALGRPFRDVWSEIWDDIEPLVTKALAGETTYNENLHLVMERNGYAEDAWFTFSYSPVRDESGHIAGMFCAGIETTAQVLGERRRNALLRLDDQVRDVADTANLSFAASKILGAALGAARVGYGVLNPQARTIAIERNWSAPGFVDVAGVHHFRDYGTYIDELLRGAEVANVDVEVDTRTAANAASFRALGIRAHLDVPVLEDGQAVGQMFVHSAKPRFWTDEEVAFVREFAERTHAAVARRTAEDALRASEDRQSFLLGLSDALRSLSLPADIAEVAAARIGKRLGASRAFYAEIASGRMTVERDYTSGVDSIAGERSLEAFGPDLQDIYRADAVITVADVGSDERFCEEARDGLRARQVGAFVDVVLFEAGQRVGLLAVQSATPRAWTPADEGLIREVGERVNAAVERARSEAALRENEARLVFLDRLGAETAALADADAVLATTTRLLGEHLSLAICAYADMDENEDGFTIRGDWAAPGSKSIVGHYSLADFGKLAVKNLSAGLPLVVHDNLKELASEEAATFQSMGIAATICMPLVKEGRLTALMAIHDRVARVWTEAELSLLREVTARSWAHVERVAATAALRESETRFRGMADHAPVMVWVTDPNGYCTYLNRAWYEFTGQSKREAEGFGWLGATHPDDKAEAERIFLKANARQEAFRLEYRLRRADGSYRWAIDAALPRFGPGGEFLGYVGSVLDIDERREMEERLRGSEARLRAVFDQAAAGFARTDLNGRFLEVNDRFCAIVHRTREELLTLRMGDITHPDDLPANLTLFEATAAGGQPFEIEKRYLRPDGSSVWVRNSVSAVRDSGKVGAILAVSIDISDQKRAEELLREMNDTLESQVAERTAERDTVWRTSRDLIVVIRVSDGIYVNANPAWVDELGYAESDILGRRIDAFAHSEDSPAVHAGWDQLMAGDTVDDLELRMRAADDSYRPYAWNVRREGDFAYAFGRDLSSRRALEEQLRQSQKMEAMGSLTGGVAHDFNNLLTPIIGSLDMLVRREVGSERERRLIDGALQSAERAKTLVQRLLAFARRQPLQPVSVEIPRLVRSMVGLVGSTLGPTIEVRVDLAPDLPLAKADPNQLEMALLNLAVNARDAMPDGGELTISATQESVGWGHASGLGLGDYLSLRVIDTGMGMDEATRQRAIEPFFSTKGVGKGTGLGLSMVHGLAAQLGGALTIESAPGKGTAIELWLPISTAPIGADESTIAAPTTRVGRGIALLVDDEELVRMSTADMLIDLGFKVVEVGSAEDALKFLKAGRMPNLLVTDHLMPGMSGADLAREARAMMPTLPVLIVSGYAELEGLAPGLPRLTKPFRNAELAASVSALIPCVAE
jgi:PAS domain S-box-containing protein